MHIPICPCRLKHRTSWTSAHVASPGLHHWLKMSPHTETSSVTRDVFKYHKCTQTTSMKLARLQLWWSLTLCSFDLTSKKIGRKNISIKTAPKNEPLYIQPVRRFGAIWTHRQFSDPETYKYQVQCSNATDCPCDSAAATCLRHPGPAPGCRRGGTGRQGRGIKGKVVLSNLVLHLVTATWLLFPRIWISAASIPEFKL